MITLQDDLTIRSIANCFHCGRRHDLVRIHALSSPVVMGGRRYSHGYECPSLQCRRLCDPTEMEPAVIVRDDGRAA